MGATNTYNQYMKKKAVTPISTPESTANNINNSNMKQQIVNANLAKNTSNKTPVGTGVNPNAIAGVNSPTNNNPNMLTTPQKGRGIVPTAPGGQKGQMTQSEWDAFNASYGNSNINTLGNSVNELGSSPMSPNARGIITDKYKGNLDNMKDQNLGQANKEYQSAYEKLLQEYENAKKEYEFGKNEVNKGYDESKEKLGDELYNQHQQLNVNASNRGISYSPQALGLEQVNNINYNKNVTKIMQQKNDLLSEIDMKIANLAGTKASTLKELQTSHLGNVNSIQQQYMNQLMELMMKDEDRDWSKEQTKQDQEWQKEYAKFQQELNKQMAQFEADLAKKNGRSGGYVGGYGRGGYSPSGGYSRDYGSGWNSGDYGTGYDSSNELVGRAGLSQFKQTSTDAFNNMMNGRMLTVDNYDDAVSEYDSLMDEYAKYLPQDEKYQNEVNSVRKVAKNKMLDKAYATSTNTPYVNSKGVATTGAIPWSNDKIEKSKFKGEVMKSMVQRNNEHRAKTYSNAYDIHKKILSSSGKKSSADLRGKKSNSIAVDKTRISPMRGQQFKKSTPKSIPKASTYKKPTTKYQSSTSKFTSKPKTTAKPQPKKSNTVVRKNTPAPKQKYTSSVSKVKSTPKKSTVKKTTTKKQSKPSFFKTVSNTFKKLFGRK